MPTMVRAFALLLLLCTWPAHARQAVARVARVTTAAATLDAVRMELAWPAGARAGSLRMRAERVRSPALGIVLRDVDWRCRLTRVRFERWQCSGPVRADRGIAQLAIEFDEAGVRGRLQRGATRIEVGHARREPDITRIDLAALPLVWTRGLLAQAWPSAQLKAGDGDARLRLRSDARGVHLEGPVALRRLALDTPDGAIAAEGLDADLQVAMTFGDATRLQLQGTVGHGEALLGTAYLALPDRRAEVSLRGARDGCCWHFPAFAWRDGAVLQADGSARLRADAAFDALDISARSRDLPRLRDAYLSGLLGNAGLGDLELGGALGARIAMEGGAVRTIDANLDGVSARDGRNRFALQGLTGDLRYTAQGSADSRLAIGGGQLAGVPFQAARLELASRDGRLLLASPLALPTLGGQVRVEHAEVVPARAGTLAATTFGLAVDDVDIGELARTLGWPAFVGRLSGRIPQARLAGDRLTLDGGLDADLFGGRVAVSRVAMERPFGVAPTLEADVTLDDLDLAALTGVLGFGSITGRLDGRIAGLRLVDWQPQAFDASLRTDAKRGVPQRISQRAVQDLSSVGDASFVSSLQARALAFFDDFGYARIGIDCRLADGVCAMGGLAPRGSDGFVIVAGRGIPHLSVVGINRRVDWPTLVERLVAVGKGDASPVIE